MNKSEIAGALNISRQTVHRLLNLLEERLAQRLDRLAAQAG